MADFTPIMTQEELDKVIGPRLKRERETVAKEYEERLSQITSESEGYKSQVGELTGKLEEVNNKVKEFDVQVAGLNKEISGYKSASLKSKIAHEAGLPYEMASRLSGESEEDIRKDADALKAIIGNGKRVAPSRSSEGAAEDETKAAMRQVVKNLNGKGE